MSEHSDAEQRVWDQIFTAMEQEERSTWAWFRELFLYGNEASLVCDEPGTNVRITACAPEPLRCPRCKSDLVTPRSSVHRERVELLTSVSDVEHVLHRCRACHAEWKAE